MPQVFLVSRQVCVMARGTLQPPAAVAGEGFQRGGQIPGALRGCSWCQPISRGSDALTASAALPCVGRLSWGREPAGVTPAGFASASPFGAAVPLLSPGLCSPPACDSPPGDRVTSGLWRHRSRCALRGTGGSSGLLGCAVVPAALEGTCWPCKKLRVWACALLRRTFLWPPSRQATRRPAEVVPTSNTPCIPEPTVHCSSGPGSNQGAAGFPGLGRHGRWPRLLSGGSKMCLDVLRGLHLLEGLCRCARRRFCDDRGPSTALGSGRRAEPSSSAPGCVPGCSITSRRSPEQEMGFIPSRGCFPPHWWDSVIVRSAAARGG